MFHVKQSKSLKNEMFHVKQKDDVKKDVSRETSLVFLVLFVTFVEVL